MALNIGTIKPASVKAKNVATEEYVDTVIANIDVSSSIDDNNDVFAKRLGYANYAAMVAAAISGQTIINGGYINTGLIQAGSITANQIAAGSITANQIAANTITSDKISTYNLTAANATFANSIITNATIANAAITTAKIGDAQITNAKITDLSVSTLKIQDEAVIVPRISTGTSAILYYTPNITHNALVIYYAPEFYSESFRCYLNGSRVGSSASGYVQVFTTFYAGTSYYMQAIASKSNGGDGNPSYFTTQVFMLGVKK